MVSRLLVDLLGVAMEQSPAREGGARRTLEAAEAAESYIARQSNDPELTAEKVAAALGVSRAALYRLFAPTGGLARYIDLHRLGAVRRRLEAGDAASLDTIARECGFADEGAARRAFRRLHSEGDLDAFRAPPEGALDDPVARDRLRWAAWMSEL